MNASLKLIKFVVVLGLSALFAPLANGQVVINEYSASNMNGITDYEGETEDWIELYNAGAATVDLSGFHLSDKGGNPMKFPIPAGTTIPANGYLLVICDARDGVFSGELHTNFKLTQTRPEDIVFADPAGTVLDAVVMDPAQVDHSRGRITDGDATWGVFASPSPNAPNAGAFTDYAARPTFDIAPGHYAGAQTVTITSPSPNTNMYYTTDGSTPTTASTPVTGPINVANTTVLRAVAYSTDPAYLISFIETNTYLINENHTMYVASVCGTDLGNLFGGDFGAEPIGSFELFAADGTFLTEATGEFNKHGNDSWAYDQRGVDYITRDQFGYNHSLEHNIFRIKNRDEFQRIMLKAAANDNYPFEDGAHIRDSYVHSLSQMADMKLTERTYEPCIVYLNGQYWGVYDIREKVDDDDYMEHYHDQPEELLQFLKTWGGTWSEYGGAQAQSDWDALRNYIMTNDLSVQANFDYVDSLYQWRSLIDYVCLNSHIVAADWLNWNTAWFRGLNPAGNHKKWRYALWDMDASFGHYINYTGIPNTGASADPCDPESLGDPGGQGHIEMLNKLMENPMVEQYYVARYIDLHNSYLGCDFMQSHLDSLIALIQPEMPRQISRWGGTMAGWQANVATLKQFIDDRCLAVQQGMVDCYQLDGPYNVVLKVDPPMSGTVDMNSLNIVNFDWSGLYYGGIDMLLEADPNAGFEFVQWSSGSATFTDPQDSAKNAAQITAPDTLIAHFRVVGDTNPPPLVFDNFVLELPNAFSPNDDGFNDVLYVIGSDIAELEFEVYNRWGQKVFESKSLDIGWDGTYNGTFVNKGVYVYKLKALFTNGEIETKSGDITLMR